MFYRVISVLMLALSPGMTTHLPSPKQPQPIAPPAYRQPAAEGHSGPAATSGAFTDSATGMEFLPVPGGCFKMGSAENSEEKPVHEVCINSFSIGKYEVTQGQWLRVMGSNPARFNSCGDNCPVENVSWNMVQDFLQKLNSQSGRKYRLPTEAEWEYAARSGGRNEQYSGGDDADAVAWYNKNSGYKTQPVGTKQPNALGIYDMSGNVWEWVGDCFSDSYYGNSPRNNPQGPPCSDSRILRGGSWLSSTRNLRTTYRHIYIPAKKDIINGFRLAVSDETVH